MSWTKQMHLLLSSSHQLHETSIVVCRSAVSNSCTTSWTVACQAPLSMRFPRQEYWSGLPFPSPGDLPNPVHWQADSLPLSHQGSQRQVLPLLFYSQGDQSPERVGNMPTDTQLKRSYAKILALVLDTITSALFTSDPDEAMLILWTSYLTYLAGIYWFSSNPGGMMTCPVHPWLNAHRQPWNPNMERVHGDFQAP